MILNEYYRASVFICEKIEAYFDPPDLWVKTKIIHKRIVWKNRPKNRPNNRPNNRPKFRPKIRPKNISKNIIFVHTSFTFWYGHRPCSCCLVTPLTGLVGKLIHKRFFWHCFFDGPRSVQFGPVYSMLDIGSKTYESLGNVLRWRRQLYFRHKCEATHYPILHCLYFHLFLNPSHPSSLLTTSFKNSPSAQHRFYVDENHIFKAYSENLRNNFHNFCFNPKAFLLLWRHREINL